MSTAVVQVADSFISVQLFNTQPVMTGFVINTFLSLDIWLLYTKRKITHAFYGPPFSCLYSLYHLFSPSVDELLNSSLKAWVHVLNLTYWNAHSYKCIWWHKESGATSIFTAMTAFTVVFHTRFLSLFRFFYHNISHAGESMLEVAEQTNTKRGQKSCTKPRLGSSEKLQNQHYRLKTVYFFKLSFVDLLLYNELLFILFLSYCFPLTFLVMLTLLVACIAIIIIYCVHSLFGKALWKVLAE